MITIPLMGGLGNQIFQIFTTIAYAIKTKQKFSFPFTENPGDRKRYWDSFFSTLETTTYKNNISLNGFVSFQENGFHYTEIPAPIGDNVLLQGYFQSYKYFEKEKETIFRYIRLEDQKEKVFREFSHLFADAGPTVSMHFRLGDYKTRPDYHNILPYVFYERSLETVVNSTYPPVKTILYFCEKEDNETVLEMVENLGKKHPLNFVKVDDTIEDWKQMLIMSNCDHNIIANSSYSWWGAFFNKNANKIVTYPRQWFGEKMHYHDTKDLCPDSWIRISVD